MKIFNCRSKISKGHKRFQLKICLTDFREYHISLKCVAHVKTNKPGHIVLYIYVHIQVFYIIESYSSEYT